MDTLFYSTLAKVQAKIQAEGSIRDFAQRLDLNPSTISRWFAEQRSPDFRSLCTILEHFNARISFPENKEPDGTASPPGPNDPTSETLTLSHQLAEALRENSSLREQLNQLRTERDMAIGKAEALKEQLERLAPAPEKNTQSSRGIHGTTKTTVA